MPHPNVLIVFVKYPEPGRVKTRLARDAGNERAAEIYSAMAEFVIGNVSGSRDYGAVMFFDPPSREAEMRDWLGADASLIAQRGASLGERMDAAFGEMFIRGAEKVVIIGTDCLDISQETVTDALQKLDGADAVIGPAEDGGYYLLGLKARTPEIFEEIEWSSERVLMQTVDKIRGIGMSYALLDAKRDIDTIADIDEETIKKLNNIRRRIL